MNEYSTPTCSPSTTPADAPTCTPELAPAPAPAFACMPTPLDTPAPLALAIGCSSKIGPRQQNDDYAAFSKQRDLFAVADGIGGAPHGDVAAATAVNVAIDAFENDLPLHEAFLAANDAVIQLCSWIDTPSTGTTLLLAAYDNTGQQDRLDFVWAGDSLALLLHNGELALITPPQRTEGSNALTAAVGYAPQVPFCSASCTICPGDRILLCTDGVWEQLETSRLAELLQATDNAPWIAESIAREAAETGHDNATALVLIAHAPENTPDASPQQKPLVTPTVPCTPTLPLSAYHNDTASLPRDTMPE